jgi:hypothetical protein
MLKTQYKKPQPWYWLTQNRKGMKSPKKKLWTKNFWEHNWVSKFHTLDSRDVDYISLKIYSHEREKQTQT